VNKNVVAFNGSPRKTGNTTSLLDQFIRGVAGRGITHRVHRSDDLNIRFCNGCLRCNLLQRCAIPDDDWPEISQEILNSDVLVFASPIYFHHLSASLKRIVDRFRSFVHVRITETGLEHIPWHEWNKDFVLILSMGSPDTAEARPVVELFQFITSILGTRNRLHVISGTRLAVTKQVHMDQDALEKLYKKLDIPVHLASDDARSNRSLLDRCYDLGKQLALK
jgi:multimeric flavodoxin WrbA